MPTLLLLEALRDRVMALRWTASNDKVTTNFTGFSDSQI